MRFITIALLALGFGVAFAADDIVGFDTEGSAQQRALEVALDSTIDAGEMDDWLKLMSETPHHVGSLASKENAEFIAELLESWGYDTEIEGYQILLPTPRVREVELVAPTSFSAGMTEDTLAEDPSTARRETLLPPYNAFSRDGEVEAELVCHPRSLQALVAGTFDRSVPGYS